MARARNILSVALSSFLAGACAHAKIADTQIDDTEENRQILSLVLDYKRAMENLDADAVLSLVSARYFEDNGNTDEGDDYDYRGLKENLSEDFKKTKKLQLDLRVDAIEVEDDKAFAELYYTVRAQNEYPSGTKWETGSDRTRLRFVKDGGAWRIIAGL